MTDDKLVERIARAIDPGSFDPQIEAECDYPAAKRRIQTKQGQARLHARAALLDLESAGYVIVPPLPEDIKSQPIGEY